MIRQTKWKTLGTHARKTEYLRQKIKRTSRFWNQKFAIGNSMKRHKLDRISHRVTETQRVRKNTRAEIF
jgi:hypothetical protein